MLAYWSAVAVAAGLLLLLPLLLLLLLRQLQNRHKVRYAQLLHWIGGRDRVVVAGQVLSWMPE